MRGDPTGPEGLDAFVEREWKPLLAALTVACGAASDPEGALAEAVARAWERADRGDRIENLRGWILTVAMNQVGDSARRMRTSERAYRLLAVTLRQSSEPPSPDSLDLLQAVGRLSPRQRQAVVLYYWADLPVAEVAGFMGVAEGTIRALLHQARTALGSDGRRATDQGGERMTSTLGEDDLRERLGILVHEMSLTLDSEPAVRPEPERLERRGGGGHGEPLRLRGPPRVRRGRRPGLGGSGSPS